MEITEWLGHGLIFFFTKIPLIGVRSYGLVGYLRNCLASHPIVESKPDAPRSYTAATSPAAPQLALRAMANSLHRASR